jgi:hypothetical protein
MGIKSFLGISNRQRCKVCRCEDKFDFKVPDEVWNEVVPVKYRHKVVCLKCFDHFAFSKRVKYSGSLSTLYFAGDQAALRFQLVSAHEG